MDEATIWEHLKELRRTLLYILITLVLSFCTALYFYQDILSLLTAPLQDRVLRHQEIRRERIVNSAQAPQIYSTAEQVAFFSPDVKEIAPNSYHIPPNGYIEVDRLSDKNALVILSPLEGMTTSFKVSFWVGLVGSSPVWVYLLLQFIIPALHGQERKAVVPFLALSCLFISMGLLFSYSVTIPLANQYLAAFNQGIGLNFWTLSNYLDYTLILMLTNALAFEMSLILFFLVHFNLLTVETMIAKRRHMIVLAFILGAILTPPDVLTQFMLAIPLIALYELTILYAYFRRKAAKIERA